MGTPVSITSSSIVDLGRSESPTGRIQSVLVASPGALTSSGGGVQLCTNEYRQALEVAGFGVRPVSFRADRCLWTRLKNRLFPTAYPTLWSEDFIRSLVRIIKEDSAQYVFINMVVLGRLIQPLRRVLDNKVKLILLSHGLESVDYVHTLRMRNHLRGMGRKNVWHGSLLLGRQLLEEVEQRYFLDQVVCLAPFEAEIERWLGAKRVAWVPRAIRKDTQLQWAPKKARFGFVGSLDHPPNHEGLVSVMHELATRSPPGLEIRVVGGPMKVGQALAKQYPFVTYLGSLNDVALAAEASSWSAFLHPVFCFARGCSTKLAVALGWQVPILTTPAGCRGYVWQDGDLLRAKSVHEFVEWVCRLSDLETAAVVRAEVARVANSSPQIAEVGAALRRILLSPEESLIWEVDSSTRLHHAF